MRYTDRDELVEKIASWKKNFEKLILDKEAQRDELTEMIEMKEQQCKKVFIENGELQIKLESAIAAHEEQVQELTDSWSSKNKLMKIAKEYAENELQKLKLEYEAYKVQAEREKKQLSIVEEDPRIA